MQDTVANVTRATLRSEGECGHCEKAGDARSQASTPAKRCRHCGGGVSNGGDYCCAGCENAHSRLQGPGLERFYSIRGGAGVPVTSLSPSQDPALLAEQERLQDASGPVSLRFDVQGIHCSACVWLIEQLFRRAGGTGQLVCNPARGTLRFTAEPTFPLARWADELRTFGYRIGPPLKDNDAAKRSGSDKLLVRVGVVSALALNAMMFAIANYVGLRQGPLYDFVHRLNYGLTLLAVLVGAPVFVKPAYEALRRGVLHFDVPVALGVLLAFGTASAGFFLDVAGTTYFDSITVFIALMLIGRLLRERVIERNRDQLLVDDGIDNVWTCRVQQNAAEAIRCRDVEAGDTLLVMPGAFAPVRGHLQDERATISHDWITGESVAQQITQGSVVEAGAVNRGGATFRLCATQPFSDSNLVDLLRSTDEAKGGPRSRWWERVSLVYVLGVLGTALVGFAGWFATTGDALRSLEVATALLVVSCPCAFGIAVPLAYELVYSGLRRSGLFVRNRGFLDRLVEVKRVVFDKTGTLTTGDPSHDEGWSIDRLAETDRSILFNLALRSRHPKAAAVKNAWPAPFRPDVTALEVVGKGVEAIVDGSLYRLGAARWATKEADSTSGDVVFTKDGAVLASLGFQETLRPDAESEVHGLREDGYDLWILSGDRAEAVTSTAHALGVPAQQALGELSPQDKERWLVEHRQTPALFVGDGVNDALATQSACCSGTPAVDQPFIPARCDFFLTTPGLAPIRRALRAARVLTRTVRRNFVFAAIYNLGAMTLALAGLMTPWLAAILMPLSSLIVVGLTTAKLAVWSPLWKS